MESAAMNTHDIIPNPITRPAIRVGLVSDIHHELMTDAAEQHLLPELSDGIALSNPDIAIFAGDVDRAGQAVRTATELAPAVPVIASIGGNHEHYRTGEPIDAGLALMREQARQLSAVQQRTVLALEDDCQIVDIRGIGVRILGATLWTDYDLNGNQAEDSRLVARSLNDYRFITGQDGRSFSPDEAFRRHEASTAFLRRELETPFDGPTVVITHHLPSMRSIAPRYHGRPDNAGFASNRDDLLELGAALWVCGHTHSSHHYRDRSGTLVVCNPCGYAIDRKKGLPILENAAFVPGMSVDIIRKPDGTWGAEIS